MPMTPLPDPPSRQDPGTFADKSDALLGALPAFVTEANALQTDVTTKQGTASTAATTATTKAAEALDSANTASGHKDAAAVSAGQASTSAATAANLAAALVGASATSTVIGTGSKTFTTQASKQFNVGGWVLVASSANAANYMHGRVTSYSTTTLVVDVDNIGGSGTFADWVVSVSGTRGAQGATGGVAGGTMTGALNYATTATLASATSVDIGSATSNAINITGTTTITALGTIAAGAERLLTFTGALTLTHNATSLILPGAANITTTPGDTAYFVSLGSGNWRCTGYQKASVTGSGAAVQAVGPALSGVVINDGYREEVFTVTGSNPALSPTNGSVQTWSLTVNSSPTIGTWVDGQSIVLGVDDGASCTVTWSGVTWTTSPATAPTLLTSGFTWVSLWRVGGVVYGRY